MREPKGDWTDLFLGFQMTLDPRKLWLAFKGLILSVVLVGLLLAVLALAYHVWWQFALEPVTDAQGRPTGQVVVRRLPAGEVGDAKGALLEPTDVWGAARRLDFGGAIGATWGFARSLYSAAMQEIAERASPGVSRRVDLVRVLWVSESLGDALLVALACGFVLLLIWSYYGGAIMRVAAVEYARGQRIELKSAAAYAWRKHHSFYGAPLGLAAAAALLGLLVMACGLVGWNILVILVALAGLLGAGVAAGMVRDRASSGAAIVGAGLLVLAATVAVCLLLAAWEVRIGFVGEALLGVLSPLAFLAGLGVAILGIWVLFGTGLMFGTIATSDSDAFQGWSRSFHYLFVHPWRFAFYTLVGTVYGVGCLGFVYVVRLLTEWATLLPLSAGLVGRFEGVYHYMAQRGEPASGGDRVLAFFITADTFLLNLVFLSFVVAYLFTSKTIAYFLLRKCADGTPVSEVHLEPSDQELLGVAPEASPGQRA